MKLGGSTPQGAPIILVVPDARRRNHRSRKTAAVPLENPLSRRMAAVLRANRNVRTAHVMRMGIVQTVWRLHPLPLPHHDSGSASVGDSRR